MPKHDCRESRGDRVALDLCNLMKHEKLELADVHKLRHGEARCPVAFVYVSSNGNCRGNAAKLVDDRMMSDVAGVNDHIRASECSDGLRTEQSVRIRDDAGKDLVPGHGLSVLGDCPQGSFFPERACSMFFR